METQQPPEGMLGPPVIFLGFLTLLIIRQVHCETQHYLIVLSIHTPVSLFYLYKDPHTRPRENISGHSLAVQFKEKGRS